MLIFRRRRGSLDSMYSRRVAELCFRASFCLPLASAPHICLTSRRRSTTPPCRPLPKERGAAAPGIGGAAAPAGVTASAGKGSGAQVCSRSGCGTSTSGGPTPAKSSRPSEEDHEREAPGGPQGANNRPASLTPSWHTRFGRLGQSGQRLRRLTHTSPCHDAAHA